VRIYYLLLGFRSTMQCRFILSQYPQLLDVPRIFCTEFVGMFSIHIPNAVHVTKSKRPFIALRLKTTRECSHGHYVVQKKFLVNVLLIFRRYTILHHSGSQIWRSKFRFHQMSSSFKIMQKIKVHIKFCENEHGLKSRMARVHRVRSD